MIRSFPSPVCDTVGGRRPYIFLRPATRDRDLRLSYKCIRRLTFFPTTGIFSMSSAVRARKTMRPMR